MKSITVAAPSDVSNFVSRTSVFARYARDDRARSSAGAISQRPCSSVPTSAAKQAPESKRGQQSQSIEPPRDTSADVSQSPMRP
jgi:hypothetical protein